MASRPRAEQRTPEGVEKHGMKGWGARFGADLNEPRTMDEAGLTALLVMADRLNDLGTAILDMRDRLNRIEYWLQETVPSYLPVIEAHRTPPPSPSPSPHAAQPKELHLYRPERERPRS